MPSTTSLAALVQFPVVPKEHAPESCAQVQEEHAALIGHIFHVIAQLARQLDLAGGYRVVTNCCARRGADSAASALPRVGRRPLGRHGVVEMGTL